MGRIAEALQANLRTLAQSDARTLRALDEELQQARESISPPELPGRGQLKALLGKGSFQQQTLASLRALCREHGIKGYSKLKKAELASLLELKGVEPPPPPVESFTKSQLVALVKQLFAMLN